MNNNKKNIINIVIDTNIFRDNPQRDKAEFKALKKLIENNKIKIFMPYIIEQEFITQQIADCNKINKELKKNINSLNNRRYANKEYIKKLLDETDNLEVNTLNLIQSEFDDWCKEFNIEKRPLNQTHLNTVITDYFKGNNPFKNQKNRNDIPDAFIFQELIDIFNEKGNLTFIAQDKYFRESCKKFKMDSYESLDDFVKSSQIQYLLKEHEITKEKFTKLKEFLELNSDYLESLLSSKHISELEYQTIIDESIPSDNNDADITSIGLPENIKFECLDTTYYGNNTIAIPVNFQIAVYAHFAIFKSDYYGHEYNFSIEDLNDHYYDAEDEFTLDITATIILTLDIETFDFSKKLDEEVFEEVVQFDSIEIDSIDSIEVVKEVEESDISFICSDCKKQYHLKSSDVEWQSVSASERQMGAEVQHEAIYDNTCKICGNSMRITFDCWEYPIGVINDTDIDSNGVENIIGKCVPDLWANEIQEEEEW